LRSSKANIGHVTSGVETAVRRAIVWLDTPDALVGWIPFAVAMGWWLARRAGASAIHASGPPFSVVCAGAIVSLLTGLPLVTDFRDAWTLDPGDPFGTLGGSFRARSSPTRIRLLKALERWILARSDAAVFTSQATRALYVDEYPEIEGRSFVVYNGADPDDFIEEVSPAERTTVAHIGTLHDYQWHQVQTFLLGFARSLRSGAVPYDSQLVFAGTIGFRLRTRVEALVHHLGIVTSMKLLDFVPHQQALRLIRASHLLLLFAGDNHYIRLSKIGEYLVAGPPVLAFAAEKSETAKEVLLYGGRVLSDASEAGIEDELARIFRGDSRAPRRPLAIDHPHPLNRRTETQQLADILGQISKI
jgi:glycosyltransferase involved in cell wall biosynthesis